MRKFLVSMLAILFICWNASAQSKVALSWNAPTTGGSPSNYNVLRGTASGAEVFLVSVPASITSYSDSAVQPGMTYFYEVASTNVAGVSGPSSEVTAVIPVAPPPPPSPYVLYSAPTSLSFGTIVGSTPPCQSVIVHDTSPDGPIPFTLAPNVPWITFTPTSGGTPTTLTVCISTAGMLAGTPKGAIVVTETGPNSAGQTDGNSPFSIPVSLTVTNPPPPSPIVSSCTQSSSTTVTCKFTTTGIHGTVNGTVVGGGRTGTWTLNLP